MKRTFATYEHHTIGFPKVVLKWCENDEMMEPEARVVIDGIIQENRWKFANQGYGISMHIQHEMERFDAWVRSQFAERPDLQG